MYIISLLIRKPTGLYIKDTLALPDLLNQRTKNKRISSAENKINTLDFIAIQNKEIYCKPINICYYLIWQHFISSSLIWQCLVTISISLIKMIHNDHYLLNLFLDNIYISGKLANLNRQQILKVLQYVEILTE